MLRPAGHQVPQEWNTGLWAHSYPAPSTQHHSTQNRARSFLKVGNIGYSHSSRARPLFLIAKLGTAIPTSRARPLFLATGHGHSSNWAQPFQPGTAIIPHSTSLLSSGLDPDVYQSSCGKSGPASSSTIANISSVQSDGRPRQPSASARSCYPN